MSTTRSGSSSASAATQRCLRRWPGVMCRSDTCSTRIGRAPGGQHRHVDLAAASRGGARCPPRRPMPRRPPWRPRRARAEPMCSRTARVAFARLVSELKERLRADLTTAMKARDELVKSTLRMTLTAIGNAEVAGTEARELSDDEVLQVIAKEAKKRAEAAEAFAGAGRDELAAQERAEGEVLARYLPQQLTDDELAAIARTAVDETAAELGERARPAADGAGHEAGQRRRCGPGRRRPGGGGGEGAAGRLRRLGGHFAGKLGATQGPLPCGQSGLQKRAGVPSIGCRCTHRAGGRVVHRGARRRPHAPTDRGRAACSGASGRRLRRRPDGRRPASPPDGAGGLLRRSLLPRAGGCLPLRRRCPWRGARPAARRRARR